MENWNNILDKLRATANKQGAETLHILEEQIPMEEQMEYFAYFDQLRRKKTRFKVDTEIKNLFLPDVSIERRKRAITLLSSIPKVKAYRALETYHSSPLEPELKNWASIALLGSRIGLSSDLSGTPQVYISSGLGGSDKKLRFFSLFISNTKEDFTDYQKKLVNREFRFQLEGAGVEIEAFDIKSNYFTILLLFPFKTDVREPINTAIKECNKVEYFINDKFLFTNLKVFSEEEIQQLIDNDLEMD